MQSFSEYLHQRLGIPDDYVAFYSRWADLFRAHLQVSRAEGDNTGAINAFLAGQRSEMSEWQMRQAHKAIHLFIGYRERAEAVPLVAAHARAAVPATRAEVLHGSPRK